MAKRDFIGELEQMVLLVVLQTGESSYAITVREKLEESAGRRISRGALYRTLDRLEDKGYLSWKLEQAGPERGGYPKRKLRVTARGLRVLRHSRSILFKLWHGLDEVLDER